MPGPPVNLSNWSATGQQTFSRSFSYDSLNRISALSQTSGAAVGCGSTYSIAWSIDPWGNRSSQTFTGGSGQAPCINMGTSGDPNNRLIGYPYDTAGNLLADASYQYQYDAENHLTMVIPSNGTFGDCSTATACYFYNAEGQRIAKYTLGGTLTTFYIYGTDGEIVADTDGNLNWNDTYIHFGGQLVAQYRGSNTGFLISDHLGSTRLDTITPYSGSQSVYDNMDYLPFGEQIAGASSTTHKFTTKERDDETNPLSNGNIGLDNFGARYNSSSLGRFTSPDETLVDQDAEYPQSWNLYSYVRNNPLTNIDEDGRECKKDKDGNFTGDCSSPGDEKVTQGDKPQQVSVNADAWAHFWGDQEYHQLQNKQFEEWIKKNHVKIVRAELPIGPGDIESLGKLAEELLLSKNNLKYILKHLIDFQKLDPQITIKEVVQIGEDVIKTGKQIKSNTWVKTVLIGGKEVVVRAAVNANNMLRTVFPD